MVKKIEKKIVGFKIISDDSSSIFASSGTLAVKKNIDETIKRPQKLTGVTYKIKNPRSEHALYITINDIILNKGTIYEVRRPFELFLNSKSMDHFQWIVALTLIISAIFRKGGDIRFLVSELRSIFDPNGGYFKGGGNYVPSLVSEIGDIIEQHLIAINSFSKNSNKKKELPLSVKKHLNPPILSDGDEKDGVLIYH
jgi:hypothetical protein